MPRRPRAVRPSAHGQVGRRRDVLVLAAAEQRGERAEEPGGVAERPVLVQVEREQVLAQEDHRLGPGQDPDVARQPELQRVLPDQAVAEGVERPDRRVRVAVRHELVHAELHLGSRLLREGQREDLRRPGAARRDQPGDPARDHLGLAGPRAGDDEERPVPVGDRAELLRVEPAEQRVEAGRRIAAPTVAAPIGDEAVPDRDLLERDAARAGSAERLTGRRGGGIGGHEAIIAGPRDTLAVRPGRRPGRAPRPASPTGAARAEPQRLASPRPTARRRSRPSADRLGVHARAGPRVEAAQDEARPARVGQGEGEALVATGVLERVEPDEPDALDRAPAGRFEDRRPRARSSSSRATA